jgi:antitoxin FitA
MASITIRNIDDRVKQALRVQAAENGRSMEEQLRHMLESATSSQNAKPLNLADEFMRRFDPLGGVELTSFAVGENLRQFFWEEDEESEAP